MSKVCSVVINSPVIRRLRQSRPELKFNYRPLINANKKFKLKFALTKQTARCASDNLRTNVGTTNLVNGLGKVWIR